MLDKTTRCTVIEDELLRRLADDSNHNIYKMHLLVDGNRTSVTLIEIHPQGEPPYYLSLVPLSSDVVEAITNYSALAVRFS